MIPHYYSIKEMHVTVYESGTPTLDYSLHMYTYAHLIYSPDNV
jgi:hypothetical protein